MGKGIVVTHLKAFDEIGNVLERECEHKRREGFDYKYSYSDAIKAAYGVFFFQHPSLLEYQERMKTKEGQCNVQTILGLKEIPSSNQITRLLDSMSPGAFKIAFDAGLSLAKENGVLDNYRILDNHTLIAMDGTWFYSSNKIHCPHCLHQTKDGETTYYHDMVAAAIVAPNCSTAFPLMPEFIRNEDGNVKQD